MRAVGISDLHVTIPKSPQVGRGTRRPECPEINRAMGLPPCAEKDFVFDVRDPKFRWKSLDGTHLSEKHPETLLDLVEHFRWNRPPTVCLRKK